MHRVRKTLVALSILALTGLPRLTFAELEQAVVKVQGSLNCSF